MLGYPHIISSTGEILEIKSIEEFEHPPMKGWYRVYEKDNSTIAYTPDIVTARIFSASFTMLFFLQLILESSHDRIFDSSTREAIKHLINIAIDGE